jgi:hypothetical protein
MTSFSGISTSTFELASPMLGVITDGLTVVSVLAIYFINMVSYLFAL